VLEAHEEVNSLGGGGEVRGYVVEGGFGEAEGGEDRADGGEGGGGIG